MHCREIAGNQSGIALVLTLLTISFLVAITLQVMWTVDRQVTLSATQREQVRLDAMVLGGVELARTALALDKKDNAFDTDQDAWATIDADTLKSFTDDIHLMVTVQELGGRLQVNALGGKDKEEYRKIWRRFLLSGRFAVAGADAVDEILDSLADWIDKDDQERPGGAEEKYYREQIPPYSSKNGPFASIDELLLVKGVSRALLYGDDGHQGIADYITVWGDNGSINVNTAPLPVLAALAPEMNEKLAQELIKYRQEPQHVKKLVKAGWYREVSGFPAAIKLQNNLLVVEGEYFEVRVVATYNQFRRTGWGVVHRKDERHLPLLSWQQM